MLVNWKIIHWFFSSIFLEPLLQVSGGSSWLSVSYIATGNCFIWFTISFFLMVLLITIYFSTDLLLPLRRVLRFIFKWLSWTLTLNRYTTAIDMWSFGCIVAELFIGLPLFPGASEYDVLQRMMTILGQVSLPENSLLVLHFACGIAG